MSKYFRLGLIAVIGVSCVLLFLLVLASQNSTFFEKYYTLLLWLNTIIAGISRPRLRSLISALPQGSKEKVRRKNPL